MVNSGYDFSGFDAIIKAGYEYKYFAEKRIEDYIEHEIVHILTGQDIESVEDFNAFFEEVKYLYSYPAFIIASNPEKSYPELTTNFAICFPFSS